MSNPNWKPQKIISVQFYKSGNGREPVKEWLKSLTKEQRRVIGEDIKTVEYGWPVGMPLVRLMEKRIWEVRSKFPEGIARVFFTVVESKIILLHGIIKKTNKTPKKDLETTRKRLKSLEF